MINRNTCVLHRIVELWKHSVYFKQSKGIFKELNAKEKNYNNKITAYFLKKSTLSG